MQNVKIFTQTELLNPEIYPKLCNLRQNQMGKNFVPTYFFKDYRRLSCALSESVKVLGIPSIMGAKCKC